MGSKWGAVLTVTLAIAASPLACGKDKTSSGDAGGSGEGAGAKGGTGANAGQAGGGTAGEATNGGSATIGGTGGTPGTGGTRGGAAGTGGSAMGGTSGRAGDGGAAGMSEGGASGAPEGGASGVSAGGGGEGGEPWTDANLERLKRICKKTEALHCEDYSRCIEDFRWAFNTRPWCGPIAERALDCFDQKATIEDFVCIQYPPTPSKPTFANPSPNCDPELAAVANAYCWS